MHRSQEPVVEERQRRHHRTTTRHKLLAPLPGRQQLLLPSHNRKVSLRSTTGDLL
ncbi:MAG: hypothetical protein WCJ40_16325 [Planctomycetota bacterium]